MSQSFGGVGQESDLESEGLPQELNPFREGQVAELAGAGEGGLRDGFAL